MFHIDPLNAPGSSSKDPRSSLAYAAWLDKTAKRLITRINQIQIVQEERDRKLRSELFSKFQQQLYSSRKARP